MVASENDGLQYIYGEMSQLVSRVRCSKSVFRHLAISID
jgi:hypothetical protein